MPPGGQAFDGPLNVPFPENSPPAPKEPMPSALKYQLKKASLLHMVCVAVQRDRGHQGPAERIADLEVVLAAAYLADIPPGWRRIVPERVVHPFVDFVARDGNVMCAGAEIFTRIVIHNPLGLSGAALRGMEAEDAAVADSWRSGARLHDILDQEDHELSGADYAR